MEQPHIPEQHVLRNRAVWDRRADQYAIAGERNWRSEPRWGIWGISDAEARILPEVAARDVIELGCGTGYISSWLARQGARVTGLFVPIRYARLGETMAGRGGLDRAQARMILSQSR